jgi:hypothetical protein
MKTVTYEGDGLTVVLELDKPSMIAGVLAATAYECVTPLATTKQTEHMTNGFVLVLSYTRRMTGLNYQLPAWNATELEIIESFHQWASLDIELCKWWIREVSSYDDPRPLSTTANASESTRSTPKTRRQRGAAKLQSGQLSG